MTIHCRDCWQEREANTEFNTDLCSDCWDARARILTAMKAGTITAEEFAYVQRGEPRRVRIAKVLKETIMFDMKIEVTLHVAEDEFAADFPLGAIVEGINTSLEALKEHSRYDFSWDVSDNTSDLRWKSMIEEAEGRRQDEDEK